MRNFATRTVAVCLLLSILFGICAFAEPAVVSGSDVNVRSGPGTGYPTIDCLAYGTNVDVIDRSNKYWYKISYNSKTGYIYSSFIQITGSSSGTVSPDPGDSGTVIIGGGEAGYVNAMYVNVRSGPGSGYAVVGTYNTGASLTVTGESGSWYAVTINGSTGYIFKQYVTKSSNASVTVPAVTPSPVPVVVVTPSPSPAPAQNTSTTNGYINASNVNMRSGPSDTYQVIDCLARNTAVTINGSAVNSWTPISVNGKTGYVFSRYVTASATAAVEPTPTPAPVVVVTPTPELTPAPEPEASEATAYVNSDGVSFRSGPGTGYSVIATYDSGKQVILKGTSGSWSEVIADGRTGYIYSSYITTGNSGSSAQQPTVTPTPSAVVVPVPEVTPTPTPAASASQNTGYINAYNVNMRSGPGSSYQVLACLTKGTQLTINSTANSYWYSVTVNGTTGYVYSQYITANSTGSTTPTVTPTPAPAEVTPTPDTSGAAGYISGNSVHFRSGPSSGYTILGTYNYGKQLTIKSYSGDWVQVVIDNRIGYVYKTYVSEGSTTGSSGGSTTNPGSSSGSTNGVTGQDVANYALQFVGCRYIWGGSDPSGFDCSGLVKYVYQHFGYTLKRVACDQATEGMYVDNSSMSNLKPGDILCFYSSSDYIGHVGIYIGNGKFVHASTSTTGVIISSLEGWYTQRGYIARRIIY